MIGVSIVVTCDIENCPNRIEVPAHNRARVDDRWWRSMSGVARTAGWRRMKCADGKFRDFCPACAKSALEA